MSLDQGWSFLEIKKMYTQNDVEIGDYAKINLCDGYYKIIGKDKTYIDLIDNFGSQTDAQYQDIKDILLASEMDYAF